MSDLDGLSFEFRQGHPYVDGPVETRALGAVLEEDLSSIEAVLELLTVLDEPATESETTLHGNASTLTIGERVIQVEHEYVEEPVVVDKSAFSKLLAKWLQFLGDSAPVGDIEPPSGLRQAKAGDLASEAVFWMALHESQVALAATAASRRDRLLPWAAGVAGLIAAAVVVAPAPTTDVSEVTRLIITGGLAPTVLTALLHEWIEDTLNSLYAQHNANVARRKAAEARGSFLHPLMIARPGGWVSGIVLYLASTLAFIGIFDAELVGGKLVGNLLALQISYGYDALVVTLLVAMILRFMTRYRRFVAMIEYDASRHSYGAP
jgi:hypothetical protein